jgi:glycosyltransferase involved in cell wall biosynthesis
MAAKSENNLIGIVMPAYNEDMVIGKVLDDLPVSVKASGRMFHIKLIVVNDGSRDSTASEVLKRQNVILINHILNSGAGAATRTGLHYADDLGCAYVLTMDSDGQHSPSDAIELIKEISKDKADFIIGSRLKSPSGNMPLTKKVGNVGLSLVTFLLLGVYVSDSQSGLKAFNKKALDNIDFHSNNYAFCSEMIWKAHQSKLKIDEVPIEAIYTDYSVSRGQRNLTGAMEIIMQLIKRRFLSFINE